MIERKLGAGDRILRRNSYGTEMTVLCFVDGETIVPMKCQDYKRIFDDDKGPNNAGTSLPTMFTPTL